MKKKSIFERQNEKDMLNILYAQRHYYNIANQLDTINFLLIFIICVFNFLEINNPMLKLLINGAIASVTCVITQFVKDYVRKGADLKKYFDYTLYSFKGIKTQFKKSCKKNIYNVLKKNKKNYKQQISNDGKSNPPGLKDWYFDEGKTQRLEIIKSVQNQNIKWDKRISTKYLKILISLVLLLFIIYVITCNLIKFNVIEFFAGLISFASFFNYLFEKLISYFKIDKYVYCVELLLEKAENDIDLMQIQGIIDNRRSENFCPPNIIHRIISKTVHEEMEFINKG